MCYFLIYNGNIVLSASAKLVGGCYVLMSSDRGHSISLCVSNTEDFKVGVSSS